MRLPLIVSLPLLASVTADAATVTSGTHRNAISSQSTSALEAWKQDLITALNHAAESCDDAPWDHVRSKALSVPGSLFRPALPRVLADIAGLPDLPPGRRHARASMLAEELSALTIRESDPDRPSLGR